MVIGSDQIRKMIPILEEKFIPEREESIRKLTLKLVEKAIDFADIVINDDMNYYKSMRHDFFEIAEQKKSNFFIIYFKIDLDMALKWNEKRGTPIPQDLIKEILEKFDPLGSYEWDKPLLSIETAKEDVNECVEQIIEQLNGKLDTSQFNFKSKSKSESTGPGIAEYYDKLTREIVSELITDPKFELKRDKIIDIRKQILEVSLEKKLNTDEIKELFLKTLTS